MGSSERSISDVLTDIVGNIQDIVRSEIRLAKTEVAEDWRKVRAAGIRLGVGALLAAYGGFFILLCIVNALSQVMPSWAAALAIGVVLSVIALVLVSSASTRLRRARNPAPRTVATLKENVQWAKHQIK
jgi:uncharacterized membrane protein YqjE